MARAIFVALAHLFPELDATARTNPSSAALRNCTCGWWKVNPAKAGNIEYAFGVYSGTVVSAYAVRVPVAQWPVMPKAPANTKPSVLGEGRRYIPASTLTSWGRAKRWTIRMYAPVRYGEVALDANGELASVDLDPSPDDDPADEESEGQP